jgi:hypothetical protein
VFEAHTAAQERLWAWALLNPDGHGFARTDYTTVGGGSIEEPDTAPELGPVLFQVQVRDSEVGS